MHVLPQGEFPNGFYTYKHETLRPEYAMVHFNFCVGHEKKEKMRKYGVWYNDNSQPVTKQWIQTFRTHPTRERTYSHGTQDLKLVSRFGIMESCDFYPLDVYQSRRSCTITAE